MMPENKQCNEMTIEGKRVTILGVDSLPAGYADAEAVRHVFAVGCKGIPCSYGGYETFMDCMTGMKQDSRILYHVARLAQDKERYEYNHSVVFDIDVPKIGGGRAVLYDVKALAHCIRYCRRHPEIQKPVFFIMACRIGPFMRYFHRRIQRLGGRVYVNPDGHEWLRSKWPAPVRRYWKISERLMVRDADLLICDSKNIERYIHEEYGKVKPNTTYISYGSRVMPKDMPEDVQQSFAKWLEQHGLARKEYYLVVGRFVPENNYETILREFMASDSKRKLVLITTENDKLYQSLNEKLGFERDPRICFVGTVYQYMLLNLIRQNAYAYIHGHEVGGTNPSLLEALAGTEINLLLDVGFNREVGEDGARYWTKETGNLAEMIHETDHMPCEEIHQLGVRAKDRIRTSYQWKDIIHQYEETFLS